MVMVDFITDYDAKRHWSSRGGYYDADKKYIASMVGNEIPVEKHNYFAALKYNNEASTLGLNAQELKIMDYMLSGLSSANRFLGNESIDNNFGENSATHSLQSIALMEKILYSTAVNIERNDENIRNLIELRQFAGLSLLVHDMGEILGEAGYATGGAIFNSDFSKTQMEQAILEKSLLMAIHAVETDESKDAFLTKLDEMRNQMQLEQKAKDGSIITKKDIIPILEQQNLAVEDLSSEGQVFFKQIMSLWCISEYAGKGDNQAIAKFNDTSVKLPQNPDFVGKFVKNIDSLQGSKHWLRFANLDLLTGNNEETEEIITQLNYREKRLSSLFNSAEEENIVEQQIARVMRDNIYESSIMFIDKIFKQPPAITGMSDIEIAKTRTQMMLCGKMIQLYREAIEEDFVPNSPISLYANNIEEYENLFQQIELQNPDAIIYAVQLDKRIEESHNHNFAMAL
jgi:hypothetical protein